jgi:hypothetical protein
VACFAPETKPDRHAPFIKPAVDASTMAQQTVVALDTFRGEKVFSFVEGIWDKILEFCWNSIIAGFFKIMELNNFLSASFATIDASDLPATMSERRRVAINLAAGDVSDFVIRTVKFLQSSYG